VSEGSSGSIADLRISYHSDICINILGHRPGKVAPIFSNADEHSKASVDIARHMANAIGTAFCQNPPTGQRAGSDFGLYTMRFLQNSFAKLSHLRPGRWGFSSDQARAGITRFYQYEHLNKLKQVLDEHNDLRAALGGDYFITPDIVIFRAPLKDQEINMYEHLVDPNHDIVDHTPIRARNNDLPILHASISCKWTMRSDRAQNTRTEALNLIRHRKGPLPHIAAVTMEPLPTRLACIAMGTGDIDCTYYAALPELIDAVQKHHNAELLEMLMMLVEGRRLRDISDLPFDLAT